MTNEQLIKSVQVWALGVTLAASVFAFSGNVASAIWNSEHQNANNSNASGSQNSNTRKTQNKNTEKSNATGERTGMAAMSSSDQNFMIEAAMGGMMEVEMGRWASQVGTSDAVKQFGRKMVEDHSRSNEELKQLAQAKGVTLPTALDQKHAQEVSKLARMKGADFDRYYSKKMLSDHQKDVAAFEKQSTKGADAEVKAFAAKTLPTLQEHLTLAKSLNGTETGGMKNDMKKNDAKKNDNSKP
jgi:putative membrane protein